MYQDVTVVKRREGMAKHGWFGKKRHFNYDFLYYFKWICDFDFSFIVIYQTK